MAENVFAIPGTRGRALPRAEGVARAFLVLGDRREERLNETRRCVTS